MNLLLNKIKELNANNRKLANEERERQMRETAKNMFGPEYLDDLEYVPDERNQDWRVGGSLKIKGTDCYLSARPNDNGVSFQSFYLFRSYEGDFDNIAPIYSLSDLASNMKDYK